jgi:hypothetical protein
MGEVIKTAKKAYNRTKEIDENTQKRLDKAKPGERIVLSDKEATAYLLHHSRASKWNYYDSELEEKLGCDSVTYLTKNKNGRVTFHRSERTGGFFYIGSLLAVLLLLAGAGGAIRGIYDAYMSGDTLNMVVFIISAPVLLLLTGVITKKSLIPDIKDKIEYKRNLKEGIAQKKKFGFGKITSRLMIVDLLLFMGIGLCCLINQSLGRETTPLIEPAIITVFAIFMVTGIIKLIYSLIASFMSVKRRIDEIREDRY